MKKVGLLAVLVLSSMLSITAQEKLVTIGLTSGISFSLEDTGFDDASTIGLPIMAEGLYRLPKTFDISGLGTINIDAGLRVGYLNLWTYDHESSGYSYDASYYTIPVLGYVRAIAKENYYVGVGLGFHAWTFDYTLTYSGATYDYGTNGVDFCLVTEAGYIYPINENLDVLGGISFYSVGYDTSSSTTVTINIGANYKLAL